MKKRLIRLRGSAQELQTVQSACCRWSSSSICTVSLGAALCMTWEMASCLEGEQCNSTASRLQRCLLYFRLLGNTIGSPLQVDQPATPLLEVVELDGERGVVPGEASSGFELCLDKSLSLVYGEDEPPVPNAKKVDSKNRRPSSSKISIGKKKRKCASRSKSGKEYGIQGA